MYGSRAFSGGGAIHGAATASNAKANNSATVLMNAASYGHSEIVEVLLAQGAHVNAEANDGRTALMAAAKDNDFEIVRILLEKGADVNAADNDGRTALMWVVRKRMSSYEELSPYLQKSRKEIVEILLENGADINAKDKDGETALTLARKNGHEEIVKLFEKAGAESPQE